MSFGPHRGLALTARLSFLEALIKGVEAVVHGGVSLCVFLAGVIS